MGWKGRGDVTKECEFAIRKKRGRETESESEREGRRMEHRVQQGSGTFRYLIILESREQR